MATSLQESANEKPPFPIHPQVRLVLDVLPHEMSDSEIINLMKRHPNYHTLLAQSQNSPDLTSTHDPAPSPTPATTPPSTSMDTGETVAPFPRKRTADNEGFITPVPKGRARKNTKPPSTTTSPTPTTNTFAPLQNLAPAETEPLPPPIIVSRSSHDPSAFVSHLKTLTTEDFSVRITPTEIKLYCPTLQAYHTILNLLKHPDSQVSFHTFAPKGTPMNKKFLILGFDLQHSLDDITEEIAHDDLLDVRRLTRTDGTGKKTPIEPILATFTPTYNPNTHILTFDVIDHVRVRIKPYHPSQSIPQCHRCQRHGHTKRYCFLAPRCVRCAGEHDVKECKRETYALACANCGQPHPASFRSCPHRISLLQRLEARKPSHQKPTFTPAPAPSSNAWDRPLSYTQPPSNPTTSQQPQPTPTSQPNPRHNHSEQTLSTSRIEQMFTKVMEMMTDLMKVVTTLLLKQQ